jgi:hypothetical protein
VRATLIVHIVGGSVAILAGYVALYAVKGATVHRRSGMLFVYAMLAMAGLGAAIAAVGKTEGSVIAGVTTCYLVITGMTTVRRPAWWSARLDVGLMALAWVVSATSLTLGVVTAARPSGRMDGLPPFPFFMFGAVALLAAVGDVRMIRSGGVQGSSRLVRHLWRMCWALWIAAGSFFLGQADEIPAALRIPALLAVPALTPLVAMLYWLWRVRVRQSVRGLVARLRPAVTAQS